MQSNFQNLLAQVGYELLRHGQLSLIDVTPGPLLARLEGCHHGMARVVEMFRGMAAWRAVTTADVTAREAEPQMNPRCAQFQALFTPLSTGGSGNETLQMMTAHYGFPGE
jgi:hypothetical protein